MSSKLIVAKWVKATSVGWLLGLLAVLVLASSFDAMGIGHLQFFMGIGMGAGVSYKQWRMLRKTLHMSSNWLWYSMIGMGIPFLLFDLLKFYGYIPAGTYYLLFSIAFSALFTGMLQCIVIKKYTPKAPLWIMGSFIGWLLATLTFFTINYTMKVITHNWVALIVNLLLILAGGIVLGISTAIFLVRILKPSFPESGNIKKT